MSSAPARRPATYEELVAMPDDVIGQIVDGELHAAPRPAIPHQRASTILGHDLGGWRRERVPALPPDPFLTIPPGWVCEVLSPATARLDRVRKLRVYSEQAVDHVWLVDPALETLEVFRREGPGWYLALTAGGDDVVRAEPFDAIEIDLANLWLRPA